LCRYASVEKELNDICEEILMILDNHLIVNHASDESKVFYYKMKVGGAENKLRIQITHSVKAPGFQPFNV
jgi:hypothetical protein